MKRPKSWPWRALDAAIQVAILICVAFLLFAAATDACADEPYVQAWAVRGQAFTRNYPDVTARLFEQRGYWGAEIIGRLPVRRFALIGRVYNEGAAGSFAYRDPSTWTRAVAELALEGPKLEFGAEERYTCAPFAGYGFSDDMKRGRILEDVPAEVVELAGPPPKYGSGVHCRDSKLRMWANVRAEWDEAVGPGAHPAITVHVPVFGEKGGLGLDFVGGDHAKLQIKVLARLFQWGGE